MSKRTARKLFSGLMGLALAIAWADGALADHRKGHVDLRVPAQRDSGICSGDRFESHRCDRSWALIGTASPVAE